MAWNIKVKKRLGQITNFDREKISDSIFKAAQRAGGKNRKLAEELAQKVEAFLKKKFPESELITTDDIGSTTEKVLIEEGHAQTAKIFILYREGQRKARKKLVKFKDLSKLQRFLKITDRKCVFTSGVFDLLHIGHARYLKKASLQGDVLVIGLNSDSSVQKLKGVNRPILGEEVRAQMLSFLEFVDFIVIYPQAHAGEIIAQLKPDIYVCVEGSWKGDFEEKPEIKQARKCNSKILVFPPQSQELSTSEIINKIQNDNEDVLNIQLVAAGFLIEDGKTLLVKQKNHEIWTPPGGIVGDHETPKQACLREMKEEIGLDVTIYGTFAPTIFSETNSNKRIVVLNYLTRRDRSQEININTRQNKKDLGSIENWKWVKFDDVRNLPIAPNVLSAIEEIEKSSKFWQRVEFDEQIEVSNSKKDWFFMRIAQEKAKNSTCWFRKVGCILVKNDSVLLTAYNRVMPDEGFCQRMGCIREELGALPGEKLELCTVLHAEMSLLSLAARQGISSDGGTLYLTTFPCSICAKAVANSGIRRLVFLGDYSNREGLLYLFKRNIKVAKLKQYDSDI